MEEVEVGEGGKVVEANEGRVEVVLYNVRAIDVKVGVCRCGSGANGQGCDTMTQARSSEDGDQTETHVRMSIGYTSGERIFDGGKKGGGEVRRGSWQGPSQGRHE